MALAEMLVTSKSSIGRGRVRVSRAAGLLMSFLLLVFLLTEKTEML